MDNQVLKKISSYSGIFSVDYLGYRQGIEVVEVKNTNDISMIAEEEETVCGYNAEVPIKPEVKNAPILLNASKTTNFEYRVAGISSGQAAEINAIMIVEKQLIIRKI